MVPMMGPDNSGLDPFPVLANASTTHSSDGAQGLGEGQNHQQSLPPQVKGGQEGSIPVNTGPHMCHSCWEEQLVPRIRVSTWVLVCVSENVCVCMHLFLFFSPPTS